MFAHEIFCWMSIQSPHNLYFVCHRDGTAVCTSHLTTTHIFYVWQWWNHLPGVNPVSPQPVFFVSVMSTGCKSCLTCIFVKVMEPSAMCKSCFTSTCIFVSAMTTRCKSCLTSTCIFVTVMSARCKSCLTTTCIFVIVMSARCKSCLTSTCIFCHCDVCQV